MYCVCLIQILYLLWFRHLGVFKPLCTNLKLGTITKLAKSTFSLFFSFFLILLKYICLQCCICFKCTAKRFNDTYILFILLNLKTWYIFENTRSPGQDSEFQFILIFALFFFLPWLFSWNKAIHFFKFQYLQE